MQERLPRQITERVEEAKRLILTPDQAAREKHDPRTVTLENQQLGYKLTFVGSRHMNNPDDSGYNEIERQFKIADPAVAVIEGYSSKLNNPQPAKDVAQKYLGNLTNDQIRLKHGEPSFTLKLASDNTIFVASPEPPEEDIVRHLTANKISLEDIIGFYTARRLKGDARRGHKLSDDFILQILEEQKSRLNLKNLEYTVSLFKKRISQLTGINENLLKDFQNISQDDLEKISSLIDPIPWKGKPQTEFNRINQLITQFRDERIIEKIAEYLQQYKKVFVVYGASHLVAQEPALRYLLES